jgi:hypothetical protein
MEGMAEDQHDAAIAWAWAIINKSEVTAEVAWNADSATTCRLNKNGAVLAYLKIGGGELVEEHDRLRWLRDKGLDLRHLTG